ncbi:MAG: hypothetical protein RLZZ621_1958 [Gemmatimonadota bacterium]|jgi:putative hemolysin
MNSVLLLVMIAAIALLTLAGTSVRVVSRLWLRHWIEHRGGSTAAMTQYLEQPIRLVHAAGTASMLLVFAAGTLLALDGAASFWRLLSEAVIWVIAVLILGQLLPRAIGRRWAPQLVPVVVPLLRFVDLAITPFRAVAGKLTAGVRPLSATDVEQDARDGLEELLRDESFLDIGATEEMAIISGVVQFGDKTVADVMTPSADLFMVREGVSPKVMAEQVAQAGYSRVPVYRDTPDQIVGMVHVFDLFRDGGETAPAIRPIMFTAPDRLAKELLFALLRSRRQVAVVRESETVLGLVTLEDLLEELVGDIRDEHDESSDE